MNQVKTAAFSIKEYFFPKVFVDLFNHKKGKLSLKIDPSGIFDSDKSIYHLNFTISVYSKDEKEMPFIKVECVGIYEFENVTNQSEIPDYFYRNSIAILFPYVRAYISLITTQANVPGIILPTMNLTGLENDLRENTRQK